jgi:hypothetical protein
VLAVEAVASHVHDIALLSQYSFQVIGGLGLVFYDQDFHGVVAVYWRSASRAAGRDLAEAIGTAP